LQKLKINLKMKKTLLFSMLSISLIYANAQNTPAPVTTTVTAAPPLGAVTKAVKIAPPAPAFPNATDSFSYAAGMSIAESLKQAGAKKINAQLFAKALNQVYSGAKTTFTKDQAQFVLQSMLQGMAKNKPAVKKVDGPQKKEGAAFLAACKKKPGITTLPNGLQYEVLKEGEPNGAKPALQDQVSVNYLGTLINGTEFDNSYKRGQPATFPLTGVIRGWTEILQLMPKGAKWKVNIPSELAYGENPPSPQIPPNSVLIFEIELLDIIKANTPPAAPAVVPASPAPVVEEKK
jgi:FKBP-type peptidyl-prolyl cis-trans isomerase FklB